MKKQRFALLSYRILVTLILGYVGVIGVYIYAAGTFSSIKGIGSVFGFGTLIISILWIFMAVLHFRQPIKRLISVSAFIVIIFFLLPILYVCFYATYMGSFPFFLLIVASSIFFIPLAMVYVSNRFHTRTA